MARKKTLARNTTGRIIPGRIIPGRIIVSITSVALSLAFLGTAEAQKDSVYLVPDPGSRNSLVRGKVVKTSAFSVTVETDSGPQEVPASRVRKISFEDEPREVDRARDQLEGGRYEECLATLAKIETVPASTLVQQQINFLKSYASGKMALRGDAAMTLDTGEQLVSDFVRSNSESWQLVVAVDLYGQLLMANGKLDQARKEFNKLTKSRWDSYVNRGYFFEGETLILKNNLDGARQSYTELLNLPNEDAPSGTETARFKLLAQCQLARISALQGDIEPAIEKLQQIIDQENADDTRLFASAYNALGTCYLQAKQLKQARLAFLHTHLLFSSEADAHAEALFNLSKIWAQTNETDRANETRELLTRRYRNSVWAAKL